MSKVLFKSYNQGQIQLFPARLDERISGDSPVRLINKIVDRLNISELISTYESGGTTPYNPRMLLKVVFYAYMNNVYSCRKIEKLLEENIHYMWLSGSQYPSYSTINRFRSEHLKDCINHLFSQVVMLLVDMGQISLEVQYVDGTKIESVANKYTFVWKKSTERNKSILEKKIQSVLSQIDEGIAQDNACVSAETTFPIDSNYLRQRIDELNRSNREQNKVEKKQIKELEKHQKKLQEYEQKLEILGERNSYSKTDPDATFMRMKEDTMNNGQPKPGYNVQIGTENQYITNFGLYHTPGDTTTLESFISLHKARFGNLPKELCADAGYGSQENYELLESNEIEAFVKYRDFHREQKKSFRENPFLQENLYYNEKKDCFVCPQGQAMFYIGEKERISDNGYVSKTSLYKAENCQGCPLRSKCHKSLNDRIIEVNCKFKEYKTKAKERLNSSKGLEHRKKRSIEPEAVFGQIKFNKQYKRFRHKGWEKVNMDFGILIMAFNLQKLYNRTTPKPPKGKNRKYSTQNRLFLVVFFFLRKRKNCQKEVILKMAA